MGVGEQIRVKIILTSVLRLRLKRREIELSLPANSTLFHAAKKMASQYGSEANKVIFDAEGRINLRFIVDKRLASPDEVLEDGSELMVLPQLGGG
jgi:molybdopterin converting factor small subunit